MRRLKIVKYYTFKIPAIEQSQNSRRVLDTWWSFGWLFI